MKFDDFEKYGIHNKAERYILIGYNLLIFLSSVKGDTFILLGTWNFNAIKLHRVIVGFIQYIAAADLIYSIFRVLPGIVSLASQKWVLGSFLCSVDQIVFCIFSLTICFLISALALSKYLVIKYPLRTVSLSTKVTHVSSFCILVACTVFVAVVLAMNGQNGMYFSYLDYNCDDYFLNEEVWTRAKYLVLCTTIGLVVLINVIITTFSSVMLLIEAKRAAARREQDLQWQGVIAVVLTAAIFGFTLLMVAAYYICNKFVTGRSDVLEHAVRYYRYMWYLTYVNSVTNFYIFTLTLSSFREFLKSSIKAMVVMVTRRFGANTDDERITRGERQRLITL